MKKPPQAPNPLAEGNIYTPHAGQMIIRVQRESGVASRTLVLSRRQVRLLGYANSRAGRVAMVLIAATWIALATQAARVPYLTRRIAELEHDAKRLNTLQAALDRAHESYAKLARMLGVPPTDSVAPASSQNGAANTQTP